MCSDIMRIIKVLRREDKVGCLAGLEREVAQKVKSDIFQSAIITKCYLDNETEPIYSVKLW